MIFTIPVSPSANRWHRTVNGRPILSLAAREYVKTLTTIVLAQRVPKIAKPTDVTVHILWYRAQRAGDVDKRGAVALDALQGLAFDSDSQIRRYTIERNDSDPKHARMEVEVGPYQP